jgi:hypothetical protein
MFCEMINVEWFVCAARGFTDDEDSRPATDCEVGPGIFSPGLSISFLNNALAGRAYSGRVNSLIMRTIYGHLTRR